MSIADELKMDHLRDDDLDALKEEVAKAEAPPAQQPDKPDPRDQEEYRFNFSYTDERGKTYKGEFVNKILNLLERRRVGILAAKLTGGLPYSSLDPDTILLSKALSHLSVSLLERPPWAQDLQQLHDTMLLFTLWDEVLGHEDYFFRRSPQKEAGSRTSAG